MSKVRSFLCDQSGATAIEYSLIAGLVGLIVVAAVTTIGTKLNAKFSALATTLS